MVDSQISLMPTNDLNIVFLANVSNRRTTFDIRLHLYIGEVTHNIHFQEPQSLS